MIGNKSNKKKFNSRFWLNFFIISIIAPIITDILKCFSFPDFIVKPFGIIDELFVVILVITTFFKYRKIEIGTFEILLIIFVITGFYSNYRNNVPIDVSIMGAFNIIKAMLIYICFKQFDFSSREIIGILNKLCLLLPLIVISDLFDIIWPDFRNAIGYNAEQLPEQRAGLMSVYGFLRPTSITFLCNTIFVACTIYFRKRKIYKVLSTLMLFLTLKVKDTIAFVMVVVFSLTKKIKKIYIVGAAVFFGLLFFLYTIMLPEHYEQYFRDEARDSNARAATVFTCVQIVYDHFPFGVGFGRFASSTAEKYESPVYSDYGIDKIYGLDYDNNSEFINDSFWPMIFGETGILGAIEYIGLLILCFYPFLKRYFQNTHDHRYSFVSLVFIFAFVCSLAKATLNGPPDSHLIWGFAGIYYKLAFK